MKPDRSRLLAALDVDIDESLLDLALTHRSFAFEHGNIPTNERLEFLGDSILGQAVTVMIYRRFPDMSDGDMSQLRASLVSTQALARVARKVGIGDFVLLGKGEEHTGGRDKASILADTTEALIGATYLSAGGEIATALVLRLIEPMLDNPEKLRASYDSKSALAEAATANDLDAPVYDLTWTGPDHARVFSAVVHVGDREWHGRGTSKKVAEMEAAYLAWVDITGRENAADSE